MGHHCCSKQKVKRGLWSPEEDEKLITQITTHGHGCWSSVPRLAGLQRCGKSCRLRWINYLRPDLKRGSFSAAEEQIIIDVHRILGNRWAQIAKHLPGRTDNEVKNFWNSCIKKKMLAQGLDPNTHNLIYTTSNKSACHLSQIHQQPTSVLSLNSHMRVASMDIISPPFITLPPPPSHELMNPPPIYEYQNPNLVWTVKNQNSHGSIDFAMENTPISSSMNPSGFGFSDENCMWGAATVEPFEHPIPEQQQDHQQQVACEVDFDKTTELKGGQDMDVSFNTSNFDLQFVESTVMPCGMYCNESSMDQLSWDC